MSIHSKPDTSLLSCKVSILIPCYNAERWLGRAIESALAQTYSHTEVIVWDDGSTDGSPDLIASYEPDIQWHQAPNQGGTAAARSRLLERASGTWIQYLDADDYLKPDKIAQQVDYLQTTEEEIDVVYGPVTMQYEEEDETTKEVLPIEYPDDPWASLVTWDLPQTGSPLWRKEALLDVGGWKEDQPVCQEHELYLRLLMAGKRFAYHEAGGAVYRQWSEETVCRQDKPKTYRHRVEIMKRAEAYMMENSLMTPQRREALNRAYLECSRMIWLFDRPWARSIMEHVQRANDGRFEPAPDQVPTAYRWIYRTLGFDAAERAAAWKREVVST